MECSLINIEKIPDEALLNAMENGTKVTVSGNLESIHFTDGAINKAFEKEEDFDSLLEYLKNESIIDSLVYSEEIMEIIQKYKIA